MMTMKQIEKIKKSVEDSENATISVTHNGRALILGSNEELMQLIMLAKKGFELDGVVKMPEPSQAMDTSLDASADLINLINTARQSTEELIETINLTKKGFESKDKVKAVMSAYYVLEEAMKFYSNKDNFVEKGMLGDKVKKNITEQAVKAMKESHTILSSIL
jgi:hypothetical protein